IPTFERTFGTFVFGCVISSPSIVMLPDVTSSKRFKHLKKVLFPEPDGPITQTTSCARILLDIPFNTSFLPKDLCKSSTVIIRHQASALNVLKTYSLGW